MNTKSCRHNTYSKAKEQYETGSLMQIEIYKGIEFSLLTVDKNFQR